MMNLYSALKLQCCRYERESSLSAVVITLSLLASLLLSGCGFSGAGVMPEGGGHSKPSASHFPLPENRAVNLKSVPFYPQEKYQCGPAALATVLSHQGVGVQPGDLVDQVYLSEKEGTLPLEMVSAGRSYGLIAYKLQPDLNHLLLQVESGYPVLVFQNLGLRSLPQWHFAVIVGYDLDYHELILRSATYFEYRVDFQTFLNTWSRAERWAYLFLKPGQLPRHGTARAYLKASLDLLSIGQSAPAQVALEQGVHYWPESAEMQLALANIYYQQGLFDQASDTLIARAKQHNLGQVWNNIAYIQLARQCYSSAMEAAQCAVELSPDDENIRHSVEEISATSAKPNGSNICPKLNCSSDE